jgi:hypothetical protein
MRAATLKDDQGVLPLIGPRACMHVDPSICLISVLACHYSVSFLSLNSWRRLVSVYPLPSTEGFYGTLYCREQYKKISAGPISQPIYYRGRRLPASSHDRSVVLVITDIPAALPSPTSVPTSLFLLLGMLLPSRPRSHPLVDLAAAFPRPHPL